MMYTPPSRPLRTPASCRMKRSGGFTLIEMLVVIAIIVLLIALVSPAINRGLERGRTAACAGNLRQMGVAHAAFMAENQGRMIPAANIDRYRPNGPTVARHFWFNALEPYMGSDEPPSRDTYGLNRPAWQRCPSKRMTITQDQMIGYGWNHRYFGRDTWDIEGGSAHNSNSFSSVDQVSQPSQTVIIGCSTDDVEASAFVHMYLYTTMSGGAINPDWPARHNGRGNYLHVDGHVAAYSPQYLSENGTRGRRLFLRVK